jgi:predicted metal-binding membrane protein
MPRASTVLARTQLLVLLTIAILTLAAWLVTIHQARTMNMPMGVVARGAASDTMGMGRAGAMAASGMTEGGWSFDSFMTFVTAWTAMMVAMMLPAAAPMLLLVRRVYAQRRIAGRGLGPTWIFAAGYLLVWTAVGIVAYALVQMGSDLAGDLDTWDRARWAPLALGTTLIVAGVYQATPLKRRCLRHCQSPLGFVMQHWRDGRLGALMMGGRHGAYCLGCCWALFAVVVAAGVMSLAWMLLLTLVVFAEKILPIGERVGIATGVVLAGLGVLIAMGATDMPWTT